MNAPKSCPKFLSLYLWVVKILQNSRQNFLPQNQENHRRASAGAQGEIILEVVRTICAGKLAVGTKIIADPEKCFRELISEKLLILLRDRPCLELIFISSNFQALFFLQDKLLESV